MKKLPSLVGDFFITSIRLKKGERKKWLKTAIISSFNGAEPEP
jgi:hypothetical protein